MRSYLYASALAALIPACAFAYYTPHNPHFSSTGNETPTAQPSAGAKAASEPAAKDVLGPGAWALSVRQAIDGLIAQKGLLSRGYDAQKPPAAVLSLEGVFFIHDAAEAVFDQMAASARFKADDNFWSVVPPAYGRRDLRSAYDEFSILPESVWEDEPAYLRFRKGIVESYREQCSKESWSACRAFLAQLFCGFSPNEAKEYAATIINSELQRPMGEKEYSGGFEDSHPLKIAQGLREIPEVQGFVSALLIAGFDVWIVDEDPQPVLEAAAERAGVSASRVVGIRLKAAGGAFTGEIEGDVPARGAKVAAVAAALGRAPDLVVGASSDDADLLGYGKGVRVLIDHGDKTLEAQARKKGWLLQPAFDR